MKEDNEQKPKRGRRAVRSDADTTSMIIKLPRELKVSIDAAADAREISTAAVVREALIDWLAKRNRSEDGGHP